MIHSVLCTVPGRTRGRTYDRTCNIIETKPGETRCSIAEASLTFLSRVYRHDSNFHSSIKNEPVLLAVTRNKPLIFNEQQRHDSSETTFKNRLGYLTDWIKGIIVQPSIVDLQE